MTDDGGGRRRAPGRRGRAAAAALALAAVSLALALAGAWLLRDEPEPPRPAAGIVDEVVLRGLEEPLAVAFARDGGVLVAEKRGRVRAFPRLGSRRSRVVADLGDRVFRLGDRGLFGLALDPGYPRRPVLYVLYTFDGPPGATRPLGRRSCPDLFAGGCPVSGRLSRLGPDGEETVLVAGWCQQYPSHGVGSLVLAPDGALLASGGEGASYERVDTGSPGDGCDDPPGEGGALRAQDAETDGDPLGTSGAVVRVDPATGSRRLVAYGLRNPFRFALRPGTSEVWIGDVGSTRADEVNLADLAGPPRNFGWPCYEGGEPLRSYREARVPVCERLYASGEAAAPLLVLPRDRTVVPRDPCGAGTQALTGLAFGGGALPARLRGALFLADYARGCIWALLPGPGGRPDPERIELFRTGVSRPVQLVTGPGGALFYLDFTGGTLHRLRAARAG